MKTSYKYKKKKTCDAVVISCIDFRFWRSIVSFVENELGIEDFDFPSMPGAAKAINEGKEGEMPDLCVNIPIDLHHVKKVVVINHEDCGAYGGSSKFDHNKEREMEFHRWRLGLAKRKILKKHPDKEVILAYAKILDEDTLEIGEMKEE